MATSQSARSVFCRMIDMGRGAEASIKVIAFWMWLETQGFQEILIKISSRDEIDDKFLAVVSDEAEAVLSSLQTKNSSSKAPILSNLMRVTATSLAQRFLSPSAILADKENAMKGITNVCREVCCVIFDDILKKGDIKIEVGKGDVESGTGEQNEKTAAPSVESKLNPFAKEWNPTTEKVSEEDRCLFLTFSNGYPLNETQIINFFNQKYGHCVERVYVHWPDPMNRKKVPPLFGKVVFKAYYVPLMILNGENEAKFWVDQRPLWCKRFNPEKKMAKKI